ncbi:MAG: hypothetical protein KDI63_05805 [Gammaproteobacteria bacterium]|nr:hypothetical protein [Gammaproteobacteria bacterium]
MKHYKLPCFCSLLSAGVMLLLVGCTTLEPTPQVGGAPFDDGFLTVVVAPGEGRSCVGTPCSVYYRVPDLGGSVEVIANNFSLGRFPAGETVGLGQYNDPVRIVVPQAGVPPAFVHIPQDIP